MRYMSCFLRPLGTLSLVLILALASTARAVVINGSNDGPNLVAPANDPGWNNVARISGASAVYLGNRWMITANHVGETPVTFSDGREFNVAAGTDVILGNPASSGLTSNADLRMFRLAADPGLPALQIGTAAPAVSAPVTMIGAGHDRAATEIGWQVNTTTAVPVWTPAALPLDNVQGFSVLSTSHMQWGQSQVQSQTSGGTDLVVTDQNTNANTVAFATTFRAFGGAFLAGATVGDSGGGVFSSVNGRWQLVGIMDGVQTVFANEPSGVIAFGDQTFSSDLSFYRDQILSLVNHLSQNPTNRFDVNNDGRVSPQDLLLVLDELDLNGSHPLVGTPNSSGPFFDVNGDGFISPFDALLLIDDLSGQPTNLALPLANVSLVPEPSSGVLAAAGLALLGLGSWLVIARRKRATG